MAGNSMPVDQSKKSNRRCINCADWGKRNSTGDYAIGFCPTSGKDVNYWNCCKAFRWNPNKKYVQKNGGNNNEGQSQQER